MDTNEELRQIKKALRTMMNGPVSALMKILPRSCRIRTIWRQLYGKRIFANVDFWRAC